MKNNVLLFQCIYHTNKIPALHEISLYWIL